MALNIEDFGEDYYDVTIYKAGEEEPIEGFFEYGSLEDVIFTMDCNIQEYKDWSELSACISLDGRDLVHMPDLTSPEYEFVTDESYDL